jgi:hypothetical protein
MSFHKILPSLVISFDRMYPSSNNKTLNARLLARVITGWAGNDEIQNDQRESKHGFLFCGNYILKYWWVIKTCYNNGQKEGFSQTDITRTGIISISYNEMFEA